MNSRYVDLRDGVGKTVKGKFVLCKTGFAWILHKDQTHCRLIITPSKVGRFKVGKDSTGKLGAWRLGGLTEGEDKTQWYYIAGSIINFQALLEACKYWWPARDRFNVRVVKL